LICLLVASAYGVGTTNGGGAKNAGVENAGVENAGVDSRVLRPTNLAKFVCVKYVNDNKAAPE